MVRLADEQIPGLSSNRICSNPFPVKADAQHRYPSDSGIGLLSGHSAPTGFELKRKCQMLFLTNSKKYYLCCFF